MLEIKVIQLRHTWCLYLTQQFLNHIILLWQIFNKYLHSLTWIMILINMWFLLHLILLSCKRLNVLNTIWCIKYLNIKIILWKLYRFFFLWYYYWNLHENHGMRFFVTLYFGLSSIYIELGQMILKYRGLKDFTNSRSGILTKYESML